MIIDIFAREYNWRVQDILDLPIIGAMNLIRQIKYRYSRPQKQDIGTDGLISVEEFDNLMGT